MTSGPDDRRYGAEPGGGQHYHDNAEAGHLSGSGPEQYQYYDGRGRPLHESMPSAQEALERYAAHARGFDNLSSTDWLTGPSGGTVARTAGAGSAPADGGDDNDGNIDFLAGPAPRSRPTPFARTQGTQHPAKRFPDPEDRFVTRPHQGASYLRRPAPDAAPTSPTGFRGVDIGGPVGAGANGEQSGASAVRPYMWTRGRTRSGLDLAIEALVSTSMQGRGQLGLLQVEHRTVAELCEQVRSVAEVAALLSLPLGVARVLLGDMAGLGVITVHQTASSSGSSPDLALMERVLSGLRRL